MEDSFFGFDASIPLDDDSGGGRIAEPSEEEYDALNDETFGSAINGDWEEVHENLVRLTDNETGDGGGDSLDSGGGGGDYADKHHSLLSSEATSGLSTPALSNSRLSRNNRIADSDLELNLSGMKLSDVELSYDENKSFAGGIGGGINLDSGVWTRAPMNSSLEGLKDRNQFFGAENRANINMGNGTGGPPNPVDFLREHFSSPFHDQEQLLTQQRSHNNFGLPPLPPPGGAPKICTLEDIERSIIIQQTMQKQQHQQQQQQRLQHQQQQQQFFNDLLKQSPKAPTPIPQQQQQQQQKHQQQQQQQQHHHQQQQQQQQHLQKQQQMQQQQQQKVPPGFLSPMQSSPRPSNNFANNLAQHPLAIGNLMQQQQQQQPNIGNNRLPPGFPIYPPGLGPHLPQQAHPQLPPHPLLNQHGLPPNFPHPHQRQLPNPHLPIALNNFAMHPNFNAMRAAAVVAGIHPAALVPPTQQPPRIPPHPPNPAAILNHQQSNSMNNMFSMRLVQEIQQNHPLLQNAARQAQQQNATMASNNHMHQHQQLQQRGGGGVVGVGSKHRSHGANGNLPHEEYDEYANLMSIRDKHWLIGIQLSQLNTETPYIDDYYYTVYRERKAVLSGQRHSQAHKDNQLNHPLTQPKGHAQLILVQMGNKNGTRNGQHRERRNSETGGAVSGANANATGACIAQEQKVPYFFTPLKFENSLGKLQYGSVTAPRKIIDAEIMSGETAAANNANDNGSVANKNSNNNHNINSAVNSTAAQLKITAMAVIASSPATTGIIGSELTSTAQRKSRHILLHIETLYRIILKLEDLDNPNAIATIIMKKKKESERIAALEQLENANKTPEERAAGESANPALKNKFFTYEIEKKEDLVTKLVAGLMQDKIVAMMNVRKGKVLLRRIMPYIADNEIRWNVWIGVFASLQNVIKKDREDAEGILYALYPEFKKHVKNANFETIVKLSLNLPLNDKKSNGIFCSKFGISSLVCLIIQAEQIHLANCDVTLNELHKENWRQFLHQVATSLNRTIQNQTICAAIESDSIQPMMNHFARFKDLKLDSLLALITEAKQQIN